MEQQPKFKGVRWGRFRRSEGRRVPSAREYRHLRHVSWEVDRCRFSLLERVFAERWMEQNGPHRRLLEMLFQEQRGRFESYVYKWIGQNEAEVAATVIQWLGTPVGFGFVTECLRQAGMKVVVVNSIRDNYYCDTIGEGYRPSYWYNFAAHNRFMTHPFPELDDTPRPGKWMQPLEKQKERIRNQYRNLRERIKSRLAGSRV